MKRLMMSLLFIVTSQVAVASPQTVNQDVDFNKVNEVIAKVGASLIEGDELFTELTAAFDPAKTDLNAPKAAGYFSATAHKTVWSQTPSTLKVDGSFAKVSANSENTDTARIDIGLKAALKTPVVSLVQFAHQSVGCNVDDSEEVVSLYTYISNQVCPSLNERIPALSSAEELVALVDETVASVIQTVPNYITLMEKLLESTQDENLKMTIEYFLSQAAEAKKEFDRLQVINSGSSIEVIFSFDELMGQPLQATFSLKASSDEVSLNLSALYDIYSDSLEGLVDTVKGMLFGIQNEDADTIQNLTETLGGYLEMVKSIISE